MRLLLALLATTTPALAHPGHASPLHLLDSSWIAASFALGTVLAFGAARRASKARA